MDTRVLKYFLEVAREGNITKAAENLRITQPTLSRQMIDLEEKMGTTLLLREKKQISLTPNGVLFQQRAKEIVALIEKTERDMALENNLVGGVVSVGCVETIASRFLQQILPKFKEIHPMVQYELYSAGDDDIREKLDRGDIDIGLLLEPVEVAKYDYMELPFREQWGVIMREDDPLAVNKTVNMQEILKRPIIVPGSSINYEKITRWFGVEKDQINIVASHNLLTNAMLLVQEGFGYAVCVGGAYEIRPTSGICFRPFEPIRVSGHILAWKKNRLFTTATSLFIQYMKAAI